MDIKNIETKSSLTSRIIIRTEMRPGDIGRIISRHGTLYHREYSWPVSFEALVARICADLVDSFDPTCERIWMAEEADSRDFLACVMIVRDKELPNTAKLRLLLVDPRARGTGLGSKLVTECVTFAREAGYERIGLWTQRCLVGARRLYQRAGFRMIREEVHTTIGMELMGEFWELKFESSGQENTKII